MVIADISNGNGVGKQNTGNRTSCLAFRRRCQFYSVSRGLLHGSAEARLTFARLAATHPVAIGGKSELDAAALLTSEQRGGSLFLPRRLGTGPFFGRKTHFADKRLAENMDLSPSRDAS